MIERYYGRSIEDLPYPPDRIRMSMIATRDELNLISPYFRIPVSILFVL